MVSIAEIIGKKQAKELRERFSPLKLGFSGTKCHVRFEIIKHAKVIKAKVTLPSKQSVTCTVNPRGGMYFLEFDDKIPEGYKRRAIDAWDKLLVERGIRAKRKAWRAKHKKGERSAAKGRKPHEEKTHVRGGK